MVNSKPLYVAAKMAALSANPASEPVASKMPTCRRYRPRMAESGAPTVALMVEALEQAAGLPADTWYSMDMSAIYEDMGLDYGALMEMTTGDVDYTALLSLLLSTVEPNDKDTAYSELTQAVDLAAQLLRDDAWAAKSTAWVSSE